MGYLLRYLKVLFFFSIFIFFSQIFIHNAYAQQCTGWNTTSGGSLNGTGPAACNTIGWPYSSTFKDCTYASGSQSSLYECCQLMAQATLKDLNATATCDVKSSFLINKQWQCCFFPGPTPTPTPTPTPIPPTPTPAPTGCAAFTSCNSCTSQLNCGWNGSSCQNGVSSCPVGASQWYWLTDDCPNNNNNNRCVAPTPTPVPPTPTPIPPTPTPSPCTAAWETSGGCGQQLCPPNSIPQFRVCSLGVENQCAADASCSLPTPTSTPVPPTPTPTPTPTSSPPIGCNNYQCTLNFYTGPSCSTFSTSNTSTFCAASANLSCQPNGSNSVQNTNCSIIGSCSCPVPPTPTPTPTPAVYSISGKLFNDINKDEKSTGESNYTGVFTVSSTGGNVSKPGNGTFQILNLPSGQYTITFSGLPQGYVFTYPPLTGIPSSNTFIVRVGPVCSVPIGSEASCSGNSIINLNAGVTNNASAWFQSVGGDMRWDSGFNNALPSSKYASIPGTGAMPGVIFSGKTTPYFGAGQASAAPFNWKVGSFSNPDVFTDTHNLIPTSYRFLLETVDNSIGPGSNLTKKTINELCSNNSSSNCTLNPNLVHGVYWVTAPDGFMGGRDLTLNGSGYTFPPNQNYVILINGDLNINEKIHVPVGSTVIFSAKGDITVNQSVGESNPASASPNLEGLYSADEDFIADAIPNNCPTLDLRLNIAGTVIANAGRINGKINDGTFVNRRDLCSQNINFPSVTFIERPDFMLNYPSLAGYIPTVWRNVAP